MKTTFATRAQKTGSKEKSVLRAISEDTDLLDNAVLGADISASVNYYRGAVIVFLSATYTGRLTSPSYRTTNHPHPTTERDDGKRAQCQPC